MKELVSQMDLTGNRYGDLVVIEFSHKVKGQARWVCKCSCGESSVVYAGRLVNGTTKSCGCKRLEGIKGHKTIKHGMYYTPIYRRWRSMKQRCTNPNDRNYQYYGARGITISEDWKEFENFYRDMGEPPEKGLTIERIDNERGYSKENCRWATMSEQGQNRRDNRHYEYRGKKQTIAGWARELGLSHSAMEKRFTRWSVEKAITERKMQ